MELNNKNNLKPFIKLLRPRQWIKNLLIFLPSILAGNLFHNLNWLMEVAGFISFSLLASAGYILNDILDIDADRKHPVKRNRPLASASIKIRYAFLLSMALILSAAVISGFLGLLPLCILGIYFVVNWGYSIYFKTVRFLDIIILSGFYILRLSYGASITQTELTGWFIITVTFACLALSANKRHMECQISERDHIPGRNYSKQDAVFLQVLSVGLGISSLVFLNIHSYFILQVRDPMIMAAINLVAAYILMLYFDTSKDQADDPVERIITNPVTVVMILVLLGFYLFEILLNK